MELPARLFFEKRMTHTCIVAVDVKERRRIENVCVVCVWHHIFKLPAAAAAAASLIP